MRTGQLSVISNAGGLSPLWGTNSRELFYQGVDGMYLANLEFTPRIRAAGRTFLFEIEQYTDLSATFDLHPDGKTFVMPRRRPLVPIVVTNWLEEVRASIGN